MWGCFNYPSDAQHLGLFLFQKKHVQAGLACFFEKEKSRKHCLRD
jgi:hypothetical protein